MNEAVVVERLHRSAVSLQLALSVPQATQLANYLQLLDRWNRTYNLTAVRDPEAMLQQHLIDCMAMVGPLARERPRAGTRLLDVGSGGGLPGVVIAILRPDWQVRCVDAVGKKAAFIRQVGAELRLGHLVSIHARVESLKEPLFDLVTSRAFSDLATFVRLSGDLLAPGGRWVAMKGKVPRDEIAALPPEIDVFHVEQLHVPEMNAERCLVWLRHRS